MARGPSKSPNRSSPAKKAPAKPKRPASTAPAKGARKKPTARKAATTKRATKATRQASKRTGKPKTASTAKHGGSSRPPRTRSAKDASRADEVPGAIGARILVQNVNVPGYTTSVDAAKYHAMRDALLAVLPKEGGLTQAEMFDAVKPRLPPQHFPGGAKAEWWVKCVQLDLEAKGQMAREASKPLRWRRV